MNNKQKAIVTDQNYLSLQGLCTITRQHTTLDLVGSYDSLEAFQAEIIPNTPDILIINISQNTEAYLELIEQLNNSVKLLILADVEHKQNIQNLWKLNPNGIVTTNCSQQEIIEALDKLINNENFYCNRILDCVNSDVECQNAKKHGLSQRELEIIQLITKGKSTNNIADKLFVSKHTINSHRKNILKKLGLKSPVELLVYAIENDLT